jgi:hypothetical protein
MFNTSFTDGLSDLISFAARIVTAGVTIPHPATDGRQFVGELHTFSHGLWTVALEHTGRGKIR